MQRRAKRVIAMVFFMLCGAWLLAGPNVGSYLGDAPGGQEGFDLVARTFGEATDKLLQPTETISEDSERGRHDDSEPGEPGAEPDPDDESSREGDGESEGGDEGSQVARGEADEGADDSETSPDDERDEGDEDDGEGEEASDNASTRVAALSDPSRDEAGSLSDTSRRRIDEESSLLDTSDTMLVWSLSGGSASSYPRMGGEIGTELEYNSYFATSDPENSRDNWITNMHLEQKLEISPSVDVTSRMRLVLESDGENPRFYSDYPYEGIYLVELRGRYTSDHYSVFGGKYEPAARIRGYGPIFFGNYSRDLTLDGRIGAGASATLDDDTFGEHTLTGHLFRVDTSRLRGELISDQWREDEHLAEAGTIGPPSSYLVTLHGDVLGKDGPLSYTIGGGEQRRGDLPTENILLGALFALLPAGEDKNVELSLDVMRLRNAGGYREDKDVVGPGIALATPSFNIGASYTFRRIAAADEAPGPMEEAPHRNDHIAEIVGRYYINQRTTLEAAYQHAQERGEESNAFGVVIRYWADWLIH